MSQQSDQGMTSDGSFQHVEPMDTHESMYTAEVEEVAVEIPVPNDLITDEDREAWRIQNNQSIGERGAGDF